MTNLILTLALTLTLTGCLQFPGILGRRGGLAPTMDRLVAAYDDLADRRVPLAG